MVMTSASRRRADQGGVFCSTKCPPGPGLENSCELPFGFVWTPMAIMEDKKEEETKDKDTSDEPAAKDEENDTSFVKIDCKGKALPPVLCLQCLAYFNQYCKVDKSSGSWTCALCSHENFVNKKQLKSGGLLHPITKYSIVEYHQSLTAEDDDGDVKEKEDENDDETEESEDSDEEVDDEPEDKNDDEEEDSCTYILVVDANLSHQDVQAIPEAMEAYITERQAAQKKNKKKASAIKIGLVVYNQTILMYQLGLSGVCSADVYDEAAAEAMEDDEDARRAAEQKPYLISVESPSDLSTLRSCLSAIFGVSTSGGSEPPMGRQEMLAKRKQERERQEQLAAAGEDGLEEPISPWTARKDPKVTSDTKNKQNRPKRKTGEAVQCAVDMTSFTSTPSRTSRILLFTNGCPNAGEGSVVLPPGATPEKDAGATSAKAEGKIASATAQLGRLKGLFSKTPPAKKDSPSKKKKDKKKKSPKKKKVVKKGNHDVIDAALLSSAVQYFDNIAGEALETGVGFDVFCSGSNELALPAYQALVEPSGGYVIPHVTFTSSNLKHHMNFLLNHTYMSRAVEDVLLENEEEEEPAKNIFMRTLARAKRKKEMSKESVFFSGRTDCIIDIRTDSFMVPTHLLGPGEVVEVKTTNVLDNEQEAFAKGMEFAVKKLGSPKEVGNVPIQEALDLSLTRIRLGRVDPLSTMAVMAQINETMEEEDDHAFFQLICRHLDRSGRNMITRVSTHRLKVAEDVNEYIEGADEEVMSVILGKAAVYRSVHGREETDEVRDLVQAGDADQIEKLAHEAQLDLDATIQRISGDFRLLQLEGGGKKRDVDSDDEEEDEDDGDDEEDTENSDSDSEEEKASKKKKKKSPKKKSPKKAKKSSKKLSKKAPTSLEKAFPPQLVKILHRLYHLRRGPLISPGPMSSMDDRAESRGLFLRFPLEDCIGMMEPKVWTSGNLEEEGKAFVEMGPCPAETLALWDTSIVATDLHDSLCVWSGKNCQGPSFDFIRDKLKNFLLDHSANRFPMAELHELSEGDSMSRRFTARMAPSHADSEDHQLANFPNLSTLSEEALARLRSKFEFYDASTDPSFRKWFWSIVSATNKVKDDGVSLCE